MPKCLALQRIARSVSATSWSTMALSLALMSTTAATTGCDRNQTTPADTSADVATGQGDALLQVGDVSIRASVVQTSILPPSVARQYGITRNANTLLLLVTARKGVAGNAIAVPALVTATVTDLRGGKQEVAMRQLQVEGLIDAVGTLETTLPDTLRFDLGIRVAGMAPAKMQFQREFFPR